MQKLEVFGANKLKGQIKISGSKNASLPILASTLLSDKKIYLKNLPKVKDIETMINLLKSLGSNIKFKKNNLIIQRAGPGFESDEWVGGGFVWQSVEPSECETGRGCGIA